MSSVRETGKSCVSTGRIECRRDGGDGDAVSSEVIRADRELACLLSRNSCYFITTVPTLVEQNQLFAKIV
jgi:hypothetical protein